MQPLNYSIDVKSPFEQAIGGLQVGVALSDLNTKGQQDQLKLQEAERQRQLQIQMQTDLAALAANPNPTARDYAQVMTRYPSISEHLKKGFDILQPEQQQARLNSATQAYAAVSAGKPEIAIELLNTEAAALRNSGKEKEAKAAEDWAKVIQLNPAAARTSMGLMLSGVAGAERFAAMFPALGGEARADEKAVRDRQLFPSQLQESQGKGREAVANATIKELEAGNTPQAISLRNTNTQAGIAKIYAEIQNFADRLSFDKDVLRSNVELKLHELDLNGNKVPDGARDGINKAVIAGQASKQHAAQVLNLATRFEQMNPDDGMFAKADEALNQFLGNQTAVTNLRKEYERIKTIDVLKLLPPGPASDRDIQLAQKGFPDATYNAKQMASFLRGMAKISQFDSVLNSAQAEWLTANHHLGNARRDITIDGVRVPTGTTFADFSAQFLKKKADQLAAEQSIGRAAGRSYMRFANPQPTTSGSTGGF